MPAAEAGFVHLHVHTAYSLREGALSLGKLIDLAVRDLQPALAVTDTNNLFAALEFSEKAAKAGAPTDRRRTAPRRLRRRQGRRSFGARRSFRQSRAAGQDRGWLSQFDAARLARLSRCRAGRRAASDARSAGRRRRGADRADRRAGWRIGPRLGAGQAGAGACAPRNARASLRRPAVYRGSAPQFAF